MHESGDIHPLAVDLGSKLAQEYELDKAQSNRNSYRRGKINKAFGSETYNVEYLGQSRNLDDMERQQDKHQEGLYTAMGSQTYRIDGSLLRHGSERSSRADYRKFDENNKENLYNFKRNRDLDMFNRDENEYRRSKKLGEIEEMMMVRKGFGSRDSIIRDSRRQKVPFREHLENLRYASDCEATRGSFGSRDDVYRGSTRSDGIRGTVKSSYARSHEELDRSVDFRSAQGGAIFGQFEGSRDSLLGRSYRSVSRQKGRSRHQAGNQRVGEIHKHQMDTTGQHRSSGVRKNRHRSAEGILETTSGKENNHSPTGLNTSSLKSRNFNSRQIPNAQMTDENVSTHLVSEISQEEEIMMNFSPRNKVMNRMQREAEEKRDSLHKELRNMKQGLVNPVFQDDQESEEHR